MALHTLNTRPVVSSQLPVASRGNRAAARRHGFTLAEALTASVVLAIAAMGVSTALLAAQDQLDAQEEDTTAITLGRQLMEEVASFPLTLTDATAGWPSVTNRSSYDTVSDFDGYTDRVGVPIRRTSTPTDAGTFTTATLSATPITGAPPAAERQKYIRQVAIDYPSSIYGATVTAGDFAIVSVNVTGGGGNSATLTRIIARNTIVR